MTKDLTYYMSLPYNFEMTPDEDGYWFARVVELDGCMTNGYNHDDALCMIKDAMRGWLMTALERNIPIPEPPAT